MNKNQKTTGVLVVLMLASISLTGCVSSPYETESVDVSGFNKISIETFGEFVIDQGGSESLTIEAPRDYLRYIIAEVSGDTLVLRTRRGFFGGPVRRAVFTIGVKDLEDITLSGAGTIKVFNLDTDRLEINLTGAGSIEVDNLTANRLEVNLASAGVVIVAGIVKKQYINLSGVGSYEAGDLQTKDTDLLLTGAGSAVVWAEEDLDVEVPGVGSVSYFGNPTMYQNISGLGSINSKGEHK